MNAVSPRLKDLNAPLVRPVPVAEPDRQAIGVALHRDGLIEPHQLVQVLSLQRHHHGRLSDMLLAHGMIGEGQLYQSQARHWGVRLIDPEAMPPEAELIDRLGAASCLRDGLLPWRQTGRETVILTAHPEEFARHLPQLTAIFGPVRMALAPSRAVEAAVLAARGSALKDAGESRVAPHESCRDWGKRDLRLMLAGLIATLVLVSVFAPEAMVLVLMGWTALTLLLSSTLRAAAMVATLRRRTEPPPAAIIARPPVVSIMVALFREENIAARLIRRLDRIDYPRDLLDILLVVEAEDRVTRRALARVDLPVWMRIVVVPEGSLRTKPRALNFGLDLCRGSIIGVYDAEDAPAPDQIRKVVERFHQRGADVACLQGVLDFYNPRSNWLSRCFTMEYAAWFRIFLPGLERLGLPIPLGGTTLFFRRATLEELGGWDAHNVTEDADLGMRLARHGYRTELIDSVTEEEANCRALPWVRQRSRWLKGYMMTYGVHMRDPGLLWRQLGAWKFAGFQVLFLCTLSQFLLAPVLWTFWLVPLGVPHPFQLAEGTMMALVGLFMFTEAVNMAATIIAMRRTKHGISLLWVPVLHVYFPLGALASYKAAWELLVKPFYWDKTSHGHFDPNMQR